MTNKFFSLAACATLVALCGTAYAQQPLPVPAKQPLALSDKQMDGVTAGGAATANGASLALGELFADTVTQTSTNVSTVTPKIAIGQAFSQALAGGGILFNAAAISHTDTFASLP
jgi:hypothetical protein